MGVALEHLRQRAQRGQQPGLAAARPRAAVGAVAAMPRAGLQAVLLRGTLAVLLRLQARPLVLVLLLLLPVPLQRRGRGWLSIACCLRM